MLCLNEYRNTKTDESRREMVQVRNKYTKCANKCRFNHNKLKTERLVNAQKQNSKYLWELIRNNKSPTSSLLTCTDFFEYFKNLGNPSDVLYIADDDIYERIRTYNEYSLNDLFQELDDVITHAEVIKAIKELKSGKSAGPDLLINEFFCEYL